MKSSVRVRVPLLTVAVAMSACASIPADQLTESDPWEAANRSMFNVNVAIDNATIKPLSKAYRKVMPSPVRRGVSNFFQNLTTPRSVLNNFLQGKPANGLSELARFLLNSTIGVGGLFDVATTTGLEEYSEDFGQTAAVWGVPDGPYLMLPLLGPQNLRDALLLPLDFLADPLFHYDVSSVRDRIYGLRMIDLRFRLLTVDELLANSTDPYVTLRESYRQNREFEIYDGDPPEDDDWFDDFLEEEFSEEN
ncbi:MAG: VacJ family lipoprotein [Proteobacteria bacterium]|nr:VacJ family lipoprotein [Pseudomonadota bacterium]